MFHTLPLGQVSPALPRTDRCNFVLKCSQQNVAPVAIEFSVGCRQASSVHKCDKISHVLVENTREYFDKNMELFDECDLPLGQ